MNLARTLGRAGERVLLADPGLGSSPVCRSKGFALHAEEARRVFPCDGENESQSIDSQGLKFLDGVEERLRAVGGTDGLALVDAGSAEDERMPSLIRSKFLNVMVVNARLTGREATMKSHHALLKILREKRGIRRAGVIINQVRSAAAASEIIRELRTAARRKFGVELDYLGHWIDDQKINQTVNRGEFLVDLYAGDPSASCVEMISKRLLDWRNPLTPWSEVRQCQ